LLLMLPLVEGPERGLGRVADRDAGRVPGRFRRVSTSTNAGSRGAASLRCLRPTCLAIARSMSAHF